MRPYTIYLEERDVQSLAMLAMENDLRPGVLARVLLRRALRGELGTGGEHNEAPEAEGRKD